MVVMSINFFFIFQLTEEEKVKVDRRREQNRLAAQRFRQKQKSAGDRVQKVGYYLHRLKHLILTFCSVTMFSDVWTLLNCRRCVTWNRITAD